MWLKYLSCLSVLSLVCIKGPHITHSIKLGCEICQEWRVMSNIPSIQSNLLCFYPESLASNSLRNQGYPQTHNLENDDRKSAIILDFKIGSNLKDVILFFFYIFDHVLATDIPFNDSFDSLDVLWLFRITLEQMQYFFTWNVDLITYSSHCAVSRHYFCCQASRNSTLWEKPGPGESENFLMFRVKTLNWCL